MTHHIRVVIRCLGVLETCRASHLYWKLDICLFHYLNPHHTDSVFRAKRKKLSLSDWSELAKLSQLFYATSSSKIGNERHFNCLHENQDMLSMVLNMLLFKFSLVVFYGMSTLYLILFRKTCL